MTGAGARRRARRLALVVALAAALHAGRAAAHTGSLRLGQDPPPVPTWLVVMTGGGVIGLSFLFASLVTDHDLIDELNARSRPVPRGGSLRAAVRTPLRAATVLLLAATVVVGLVGPAEAGRNAAVVFVWAGWWAGYTATVYLVGDTWPLLNPWRAVVDALPAREPRDLPGWVGPWAAVAGLLGLVWLEVVTPVAGDPRLLAWVVVGYTAVTVAGASLVGADAWFGRVDPVTRVFRCYGWIAPVQRTGNGLALRWPGAAGTDRGARAAATPAFVVALLWATTFDGVVSTPAWRGLATPVVEAGVPPLLLYLAAVVGGYAGFRWVYRLACRLVRRSGRTYLAEETIRQQFATSLLPIAAGYHAAHFLAYAASLMPPLLALAADPLSPAAAPPALALPGWTGALGLLFILVGHVLAIWIAHSVAFDHFAGRLQPLRSQYPLVAVMIAYTMTSMWIVVQPTVAVPFVG